MKKSRRSKRRERILELLSEPGLIDGLTIKEIITALEPETKIYDEHGKLDRKSTQYKSWSRTLLGMRDAGILTRIKRLHETVYVKAP